MAFTDPLRAESSPPPLSNLAWLNSLHEPGLAVGPRAEADFEDRLKAIVDEAVLRTTVSVIRDVETNSTTREMQAAAELHTLLQQTEDAVLSRIHQLEQLCLGLAASVQEGFAKLRVKDHTPTLRTISTQQMRILALLESWQRVPAFMMPSPYLPQVMPAGFANGSPHVAAPAGHPPPQSHGQPWHPQVAPFTPTGLPA